MMNEGWKEAAIAWEVCASIHREYAKGNDALFKTRQNDFVNAANKARAKAQAPTPPVQQDDEALQIIRDLIADLEHVGSDGWMTGQVHSDEYNAAQAFLTKRGAA